MIWDKIKHFWIFTNYGVNIFDYSFDETGKTLDANLFGGLVSAIKEVSSHLYGGHLEAFNLGSIEFHISLFQEHNLFFVIQSAPKSNKEIREIFSILEEKFKELFGDKQLVQWDGNLREFDQYKEIIHGLLEKPGDKLKRSLWM